MREIDCKKIIDAVAEKLIEINVDLDSSICNALKSSLEKEESPLGKDLLKQILENSEIAAKEKLPICQDTGVVVVFVEVGENLRIKGMDLKEAINAGVAKGYEEGYLRKSMVCDPIFKRINTGDNTPAIIHIDLVQGEKLKIEVAAKGGGSENMSQLKMLKPADGPQGIIDFICQVVEEAGPNPCPPLVIGVGIGGTMEKAALLSKKALFFPPDYRNTDPELAQFEEQILSEVNKLGVGPLGLGGRTTALGINILTYPCHIASLPVAVNLNCHAARHGHIEF